MPLRVRPGAAWGLQLRAGYISAALDALLDASNVAVNRPAVDDRLAILNAGGDFADGLIAYEGNWLGAETLVSLDKRAVSLITKQGKQAKLPT
jgi:predicted nucleic-acid-binding protein